MTPSFREALAYWFRLGCLNFGGPAGQIAMMQTDLVDRRKWVDQGVFLRGLSFATLLPGPEAQQLATYIGWRLHGLRGGIVAGGLFILPGAILMWALSWIAASRGDTGVVGAIFDGLKPVVIAIIADALWRVAKRALHTWQAAALAVAAFVGIYFLRIDFPWIVIGAALIGWLAARGGLKVFTGGGHAAPAGSVETPRLRDDWPRIARVVAISVVLWIVPVFFILAIFGPSPFRDIARLFTTAAFVTFGGAYAVLPYVADAAVNLYGWLNPGQMLNGLALAETTPGPLILVLQYVGFFAGWNADGLGALGTATLAALLTTYVTFLPSFMFILVGAPYIEGLHARPELGQALGAITAAVVGVILNLGVFLAVHVFVPARVDWIAIAIAAAAFLALNRYKIAMHWLVIAGAAIGMARLALT